MSAGLGVASAEADEEVGWGVGWVGGRVGVEVVGEFVLEECVLVYLGDLGYVGAGCGADVHFVAQVGGMGWGLWS